MILKQRLISNNLIIKSLNLKNFNKNYQSWLNNKDTNKFLECRFRKYSLNDIKDFILQSNKKKNCFLLGIFLKKENIHIGNIKIDNINKFHSKAEIGILIGEKKYWNKGFATEAIISITRLCFCRLNLSSLFAGCYENNKGSYKAFIKAGWKKNCIIRNFWKYQNKKVNEIILSVEK
jgi:RimJ/RimL family protein N-acetyltransferase